MTGGCQQCNIDAGPSLADASPPAATPNASLALGPSRPRALSAPEVLKLAPVHPNGKCWVVLGDGTTGTTNHQRNGAMCMFVGIRPG